MSDKKAQAAAKNQKTQTAPQPAPGQALTAEQLVNAWFTPVGLSEDQGSRAGNIRAGAKAFCHLVLQNTKPCADQTAALRKIREASLTLVQAISLEEVGK